MSDRINIPQGELRVIRLFQIDLPPEQARFLREPGAVADLLGLPALDHSGIDILRLADLDGVGLAGYLREGCDVPAEDIARAKDALAGAQGHVMLLHSRAFQGQAMAFDLPAGIRPLAEFGVAPTDWTARGRIDTDSARIGSASKMPPRDARRRAQRIGASIFAVFMVLIALVLLAVLT